MSEFALIVAAHGSDKEPTVNQSVRELAERAAALAGYKLGCAAFHQGTPSFTQVLDQVDADHAVIVPLMTSDGYYCETVLPRALVKNRRYARMMVHKTAPVGTHPAMAPLVEARAERLLVEHGAPGEDAALAVVGHGTERHARSRAATEQLAETLTQRGRFVQVVMAFLDEEPAVESILHRSHCAHIVVEPFFISDAHHARIDVPKRLGLTTGSPIQGPMAGRVADRLVLCDTAVGSDDAILSVVIARAVQGRSVLSRRIAGAA